MICPRLDHFARLNQNGTIGKCGHMTNGKEFNSFEEMQNSTWLDSLKNTMLKGEWPAECVRCQMTEHATNTSLRLDMIERDIILKSIKKDYLIIGGVLDNICNSACQTCHSGLSTKIGSLHSKDYKKINNYQKFFDFPQDRICELDINGGEPTASPNYKELLKNLPGSVKIVRLNTNGSKIIPEIEEMLRKDVRLIVTMSFDGVGLVHDYVRWPITWTTFTHNTEQYIKLKEKYHNMRLNLWTTLSCLNVFDMKNMLNYAREKNIEHSYGFCVTPNVLDIRNNNRFTRAAKELHSNGKDTVLDNIINTCCSFENNNDIELENFMLSQDRLRKIDYKQYITVV